MKTIMVNGGGSDLEDHEGLPSGGKLEMETEGCTKNEPNSPKAEGSKKARSESPQIPPEAD